MNELEKALQHALKETRKNAMVEILIAAEESIKKDFFT